MDEEKHYPGGAAPEEIPQEVETPVDTPEEKPEEPKTEEPKAEEAKEDADPNINKKRSIYDDLKDKKKEAKEAKTEAEQAKARVAELEALLGAQNEAATPKEQAAADDEVTAFLNQLNEDGGLTPEGVDQLLKLAEKRVKPGDGLSEEDRALLAEFKAEKATRQREAEDAQVLAYAETVQKELSIHDQKELKTVMDKLIELSHTKEFHDKEVDYILWKNKDTLSKLVSPKRPSFESGDTRQGSDPSEPDYSTGKVTPEQVSKAIAGRGRTSGYEVRKSQ